jgi:hypothetical protein
MFMTRLPRARSLRSQAQRCGANLGFITAIYSDIEKNSTRVMSLESSLEIREKKHSKEQRRKPAQKR